MRRMSAATTTATLRDQSFAEDVANALSHGLWVAFLPQSCCRSWCSTMAAVMFIGREAAGYG
jgi:hypothetical protein